MPPPKAALRLPPRKAQARLNCLRGFCRFCVARAARNLNVIRSRSEEQTSELQSRENLVCRLLNEIKKRRSGHLLKYLYAQIISLRIGDTTEQIPEVINYT